MYPDQSGTEFFEGFAEYHQQPVLTPLQADTLLLQQQLQLQEQQQAAAAAAANRSLMDLLPLPPDAPDFSATERYMAAIEWAGRPEVQAATAAAAARNLADMRMQAEAAGTLLLLPSFVRDPRLITGPEGPWRAGGGEGFGGRLPEFPDPKDPDAQDRRALYLAALDQACTPDETLAVTNAIIADVIACDCADMDSDSSLAARGYAAAEPDADVQVETLLTYGADTLYVQQGCLPAQLGADAHQQQQLQRGFQQFLMLDDAAGVMGEAGAAPAVQGGWGGVSSSGIGAGSFVCQPADHRPG
jgi:hypothetical protein